MTEAALQILQNAQNNGVISEERATQLRKKYEILHETVLTTIENEKCLLHKAQQLNETVFAAQKEAEKDRQAMANGKKELSQLRTELQNNALETQELETEIDMNIMEKESIQRTNKELQQEMIDRRNKSETMIQPIVERLNTEIKTLNDEIESSQSLHDKEHQIVDEYNERIKKCKQELAELERKKLHKRQRLIRQKSEPERLEIQCQVLMRNVDKLRSKKETYDAQLGELNSAMSSIAEEKKTVDLERYRLAESLMRLRDAMDNKEGDIDEITRKVEHSKHKIEDAEELRMQLTIELNESKYRLKRESDSITKLCRVFEDTKRKYELLRRKKESIKQLILPLEEEYDRSNKKLTDLAHEMKRRNKVLAELKEDIDMFIASYLNEEDKEGQVENELLSMRQTMAIKESLIEENRVKERVLRQRIRELSLEREGIVKEASEISANMHCMKQNAKVKEIFIMDLNRASQALVSNLKQCRKQYEVMKNSRNRYANAVQNTYQALAEMKEKMKIVRHELEILRNENVEKESALMEEKRILSAAQHTRDQLRFELTKSQNLYLERKAAMCRYEMDINKLQISIKKIDHDMRISEEQYAAAVKDRNRLGLQLIDRNDELSILYQKKHVTEDVLKRANQLTAEKEECTRTLKLKIEDLLRSLQVKRKKVPSDEQQREYAKQYCEFETQLKRTRRVCAVLSNELQIANPSTNPTRYRCIEGADPSHHQLKSNIAVLSWRLTTQKEQLLEKELILEEVTGLTDKLRLQAVDGHESTLHLAKKMNSLQFQVKKVTRSMMATVSELSMYQATSLKLETERQSLQRIIDNGTSMMQQNRPPFEEAEIEWQQIQRVRLREINRMELTNSRGVNHRDWSPSNDTDDTSMMPHKVQTTAESRPNAYIADDIGIPKPYGAHAPFKPSELGANLRHIKKPKCRQVIM
eukprot:185833_1